MNSRGASLTELLVATLLFALVVTGGGTAFRALLLRIELTQSVRLACGALHHARSEAMVRGEPMRVSFVGDRIRLFRRGGGEWPLWREWRLGDSTRLSASAAPVFTAIGSVSPLCSVEVAVAGRYRSRITLAISGRVRVSQAP